MSLTTESPEFSRNYGFWSETEQQAVLDARVAIAGVGGDGFQLGQKLAMMGVQRFSVADPETFERENINRVPGARTSTLGRLKAEVFRDTVHDINPCAEVRVYTDGVNADNVSDWSGDATLVYDESELTYPHIGTMVARAARSRGVPNVLVMNIGFAAQVTSFHPHSKHTFERIMGIPTDMPLDEVAEQQVDFNRCIPYIPPYTDFTSFEAVVNGAPLPSIAPGVDLASAIGTSQGFLHMVSNVSPKRPDPVWAPRFRYIDALDGISRDTRVPRASSYIHTIRMLMRTKLGLNPPASYRDEERLAREIA